jgi:hypothetical protein
VRSRCGLRAKFEPGCATMDDLPGSAKAARVAVEKDNHPLWLSAAEARAHTQAEHSLHRRCAAAHHAAPHCYVYRPPVDRCDAWRTLQFLHRARVQHARLRMVIAKYQGLEAYTPMLGDDGFVRLSDLHDCPTAELEPLMAKMKVPHAKLFRRLHTSLLLPQSNEWASFVKSRERTTQDLCHACSLSECAPRFITEGYDFTFYFLEAADAELEELLVPLRPVERRRLLRVIGRPVAFSRERAAAAVAEDPPLHAFCAQPAAADEVFATLQSRTVCSLAEADPQLTSFFYFFCSPPLHGIG